VNPSAIIEKGLWALLIPLLAGAALLLHATGGFGLGVSHDSVVYLDVAQTPATQGTLARPSPDGVLRSLTVYPPLYPSILATRGLSMRTIHEHIRPFNIALFVGTCLLVGVLSHRATNGSAATALASSGLAALSFDVLTVYSRVWSEAPFLFLTLCGLLLLGRYAQDPGWKRLCLAALPLALAWLTRYIGVVFLPAGILIIWLLVDRDRRTRTLHAALYCAVVSAPMGVALMRNRMRAGDSTNRTLMSPAIAEGLWREGFNTVSGWLVPASSSLPLKVAAAGVLAGVLAYIAFTAWRVSRRRTMSSPGWQIASVLWLFLASYLVGLMIATAFFDRAIPWSPRILSPVLLTLFVLVPSHLYEGVRGTRARYAAGLAAVALLSFYGLRGMRWANSAHEDGLHYNTGAWHRTRAFTIVNELPRCVELHSNNPELLQWITGRRAWAVGTAADSKLTGLPERLRTSQPVSPFVLVLIHDFEHGSFLEKFPDVMSRMTAVWQDRTASVYALQAATGSTCAE